MREKVKDKNNKKIKRKISIITMFVGIFLLFMIGAISLKGLNKTNALESENINSNNEAQYNVLWLDEKGNELKFEIRSGKIGSTVSVLETDKIYTEYIYDVGNENNIVSSTLQLSGTILKLYFKKDIGDAIQYTVKWYDTNNNQIRDPEIRTGMENSEVQVTDSDKIVSGYIFNPGDPRNILSEVLDSYNKVLELYFVLDENIEEKVKIEGIKIWEDENDKYGKRPESIVLQIKNDEEIVEEMEVSEEENWSHEFEVPKYNKDGNEIEYIVDEKETNELYEKRIEGYTVINKYIKDEEKDQESNKDKENTEDNLDNDIDKNIENVDTSDINIFAYISIFIIAIVGVIISVLSLNKAKNIV